MAWLVPQSQTDALGVFVPDGYSGAYVAPGVTLGSTGFATLRGGDDERLVIDGTVAGPVGVQFGFLFNTPGIGGAITVGETGTVIGTDSYAVTAAMAGGLIRNGGRIEGLTGGAIAIDYSDDDGGGGARIENSGRIIGAVDGVVASGYGFQAVVNTGLISAGTYAFRSTGVEVDSVVNYGRMVGDVVLGAGNDFYRGTDGGLTGELFGGDGDDVLLAGRGDDRISGGAGADVLSGGSGDDVLLGREGADTFRSGAGRDEVYGAQGDDLFVFRHATAGVMFVSGAGEDVDTLQVDISARNLSVRRVDASLEIWNAARGGEAVIDRQYGAEGGGAKVEIVKANAVSFNLAPGETGTDQADILTGAAGAQTLRGGRGDDILVGGGGGDTLYGGADADIFLFSGRADSRTSGRDLVADFRRAQDDRISLRALDADADRAGDQTFRFVGEARAAGDGVVGYRSAGDDTIVDVNFNGAAVDLSFRIAGAFDLTAGDFIL